ncbi:unnamed protein product [Cuscuta europaea]|uniref:Uncharacterized protein n=1 Tax=Cuscuta europaea TaxID=41803 RepID=A0A9P0ZU63_CUSEU|nr:unnamed protein product [Cuscuta europaea]
MYGKYRNCPFQQCYCCLFCSLCSFYSSRHCSVLTVFNFLPSYPPTTFLNAIGEFNLCNPQLRNRHSVLRKVRICSLSFTLEFKTPYNLQTLEEAFEGVCRCVS